MRLNSRVGERHNAWPLVRYLADRFRYLDVSGWERFVLEGKVLRGDDMLSADTPLLTGDIITCLMPDEREPPADLDYRVIYEDPWLLGVDKPGNLLVHRRGKSLTRNLIYQIRYRHTPPYPEADIVNRLDRRTSGVVLLARDRRTLSRMHEAFEMERVEKIYLGLVHGLPRPREGCIILPIGRVKHEGPPLFGVGEDVEDKKDAITMYRVIRPLGERHALVELRPRTGRTHQLRVHLNAIGHPLVGDPLYHEQGENSYPESSPFPRQALHCGALQFLHPVSGEPVSIAAPFPGDMEQLCRTLEENPLGFHHRTTCNCLLG